MSPIFRLAGAANFSTAMRPPNKIRRISMLDSPQSTQYQTQPLYHDLGTPFSNSNLATDLIQLQHQATSLPPAAFSLVASVDANNLIPNQQQALDLNRNITHVPSTIEQLVASLNHVTASMTPFAAVAAIYADSPSCPVCAPVTYSPRPEAATVTAYGSCIHQHHHLGIHCHLPPPVCSLCSVVPAPQLTFSGALMSSANIPYAVTGNPPLLHDSSDSRIPQSAVSDLPTFIQQYPRYFGKQFYTV